MANTNCIVQQLIIENTVIPCIIERKRVKNINLRIRYDETIYISAPPSMPQSQIQSFIEKKQAFIIRALHNIRTYKQTHRPVTLSDKEALCIDGKPYVLDWRRGLQNKISLRGTMVYMETKTSSFAEKRNLYHRLLFSQGERLFPQSIDRVFPLLHEYALARPSFRQRIMKSRWGSCMPQKKIITLNTYLAIMPGRIVDHVVLHELCHLVHPDHSRHFYNMMTMIMPDWKERRAAMEQYMSFCI